MAGEISTKKIVLAIGLLAVLAGMATLLWLFMSADPDQQAPFLLKPDVNVNVPCDLSRQLCRVNLGEFALETTLSPAGLPELQPLQMTIRSDAESGVKFDSWFAWFEGRDMDMGRHFFRVPVGRSSSDGVEMSGMIPVCSVDRQMVWRLAVQFRHNHQLYRLNYELQSTHDS